MAEIRDYKDLIVWQKGRLLVKEAYSLIRKLPKEEQYGLAAQMQRSAISIPSNIAEGYGRNYRTDYIRFLNIARGSCYELETQLILCEDLGYLTEKQIANSISTLRDVECLLNALIRKLEASK